MVPVIIFVRIGVEFGLVETLGLIFYPIMSLLGLPAEMGLVWVTTAFVGIYAGAAALFGLVADYPLTNAQMTVLGSIMLFAHGLPVEQRIVQKAGPGLIVSTVFRLLMTFVYGWVLYKIYDVFNLLQGKSNVAWVPEASDSSITAWLSSSAITLFWIFWIILALIFVLRIMDLLKITKLLTRVLAPALRIMGIGENSAPLAMVGVLLGLTLGGGLIIREARTGHLQSRSVFLTMAFLILCHSLIEDTLFIVAIGGHWSGVLLGRIIFTVIIMVILGVVIHRVPDEFFYRYLYKRP
jgi:hypothetical protein